MTTHRKQPYVCSTFKHSCQTFSSLKHIALAAYLTLLRCYSLLKRQCVNVMSCNQNMHNIYTHECRPTNSEIVWDICTTQASLVIVLRDLRHNITKTIGKVTTSLQEIIRYKVRSFIKKNEYPSKTFPLISTRQVFSWEILSFQL